MRSPTYELLDQKLGDEDLATFVTERRRQHPRIAWDRIARELSSETGVYVSHVTLARWFPELTAKELSA